MPVTFTPAPYKRSKIVTQGRDDLTASSLFSHVCSHQMKKCEEIVQSSFGSGPDAKLNGTFRISSGGLVTTIADAYSRHDALSIRPDDVWLAILSQFSFYVNAHAEELRGQFVAHEGKKRVEVTAAGTRYTANFAALAQQMTYQMEKHIVDPDIRTWIAPSFSTTTYTDTTAAAILMMATMKKYFSYSFCLMCSMPRVTLEGEKADWEDILRRIEKLKQYGAEPTAWLGMLRPILTRFVRAFDTPDAQENLDFWQKVAHYTGGGSGPSWLSGWVTAFAVWNTDGQWLGVPLDEPEPAEDVQNTVRYDPFSKPRSRLSLDGARYHVLESSLIPPGFAEVDVNLNDNREQFKAVMVAGLVAHEATRGTEKPDNSNVLNTIKPVAAWWMFIEKENAEEPVNQM